MAKGAPSVSLSVEGCLYIRQNCQLFTLCFYLFWRHKLPSALKLCHCNTRKNIFGSAWQMTATLALPIIRPYCPFNWLYASPPFGPSHSQGKKPPLHVTMPDSESAHCAKFKLRESSKFGLRQKVRLHLHETWFFQHSHHLSARRYLAKIKTMFLFNGVITEMTVSATILE